MPIERSTTPPPIVRSRPAAQERQAQKKATDAKNDRTQKRLDGVNSIASALHLGLLGARQTADAGAVNRHAPAISAAIVEYAEGNDKFGESLDRLSDVSPLAGIAMAVVPLALQICVNHNLFGMKAEALASAGVVTPDTLESESNMYLLQVQRQAMQAEMAERQAAQETYNAYIQMQREEAARKAEEQAEFQRMMSDDLDGK